MSSSSHFKRPPLQQSGPVRNSMAPPANVPRQGAPQDMFTTAGAAVCGVLENGVRTAYAVIDDYMRRGQEAARTIFNDPNRRGYMSDDRGSFPGGFNPGGGFGPTNPMNMLAEQWMLMMRAWSNACAGFVPGQWQGMNPFANAGSHAATVTVSISSSCQVEVTANLYPGADIQALVSEPLRAEGSAASIDSASVVREGFNVRITVKVGDKQAAGVYRGNIRRKTDGNVAGELTVVVS